MAIARRKTDAVRHLLAEGFDPSRKRKAERETLVKVREAGAREWYVIKRDQWAASYGGKIMARFEADVFPWIGKQPIANITPPQVLEVMRRIEARGVVETAHRASQDSSQVFRYALATGKAATNPARELMPRCGPCPPRA